MSRCDLNVTLPVHNEAACLARNVSQVVRMLEGLSDSYEVIIVDNGSSDATPEIAQRLVLTQSRVRFMRLSHAGRGRAIREAWQSSRATIVSYMDIDLSTDLICFPRLIEPLQKDKADMAIGSRLLDGARVERCWHREWISRSYVRMLESCLGGTFSDYQCGFKAALREAVVGLLPTIQNDKWFFDTELLFAASRKGYRVAEIPVRWREDRDSRVRLLPTVVEDILGVYRLRKASREGRD